MASLLHFVAGISSVGKISCLYAGRDGADAEAAFDKAVDSEKFALVQIHRGSEPARVRTLGDVEWSDAEVKIDPPGDPSPAPAPAVPPP